MSRMKLLAAGLVAAAALTAAPAMAQEATQEPGMMGFNYPDSHYLTGGYGHTMSPRPGFYFRHQYPGPSAMIDVPVPVYPYGYVGPGDATWIGD